jgi:putative ABC transport system substrate-binding protein
MRRREFITLLGGAVAAWPVAAGAQQGSMPMIGYLSSSVSTNSMSAFRKGLGEMGYVEGKNVAIEYRIAERYDQLPALAADLVRRRVSVMVAQALPAALAAKAATNAIPIVFSVADDPVRLGLVASLARPQGNLTGVDIFSVEVVAKRLGLLHVLVPKAALIAIIINPANTNTQSIAGQVMEAVRAAGLQGGLFTATSIAEIDAAFANLARERADAVFIAPDSYFASRRVQFAMLAARYAIPAAYFNRDFVEAGGLMSYASDIADSFRLVGVYAARILKGAKPGDLPVMQSAKFELVLNLHTAGMLGLEIPPSLFAIADEAIE